ncbi:MAG: MaoC family dehydratase N-terminal domain-containing protein [Candidatus Saccharibacteria bacterium]
MVKVGDVISWERTFTVEDVRLFAQISQDQGIHHMQPDEQGRLLVHGLLAATLPTKIGGQINLLARDMNYSFSRPAYTGDLLHCDVTITRVEQVDDYYKIEADCVCKNQNGEEIFTAYFYGKKFY